MAYLHGYKCDIFISYSHLDNQPDVDDQEGWVYQFHESLEISLTKEFGHNRFTICRDIRIAEHEFFKDSIADNLRQTALLVCITSPCYIESSWCKKEYEIFCSANKPYPPRHKNKSRILNIRIRGVRTEDQKKKYEEMFGSTLGQKFYESDLEAHSYRIYKPNDPDDHYQRQIDKLAWYIHDLLEDMQDEIEQTATPTCRYVLELDADAPAFGRDQAKQCVARLGELHNDPRLSLIQIAKGSTKLILEGPRETFEWIACRNMETLSRQLGIKVTAFYPGSLDAIMLTAKKRLIISGHTLNRFSRNDKVSAALVKLLNENPKIGVTIILLNPKSKYARAHVPYHLLESTESSDTQYHMALEFFGTLFESGLLTDDSKARLEVLLSNYMPRFRVILVDNRQAYVNLYMYREDVNDYPDVVFEKNNNASRMDQESNDSICARIVASISNLINAPEIIPFIRNGRHYTYWAKSHLAKWDRWKGEVRKRQRITHQYYTVNASKFHYRYGDPKRHLEPYVAAHLDLLGGRTLVLGCGSGKEVYHLSKHCNCPELYGVDFSPEAINLAQTEHEEINAHFIVADFYDLEYIVDGEFDSIVANAALVHLFERKDMEMMLNRIWEKLRPGGKFLIRNLYKEKEGGEPLKCEIHEKDQFKSDRWFVYYSRTQLAKLARKIGFTVDDDATESIAKDPDLGGLARFGNLKTIMEKGFPHASVPVVKWPTLLLVKPKNTKSNKP